LLVKRHEIGEAAFMSEYQMRPQRQQFALAIEPKTVKSKVNRHPRCTIPDGFVFVSCATDVNPAYALTTTIVAYKTDTTSAVVAHIIKPIRIDQKLNATEYNQRLFDALAEHGREIRQLGVPINGWGIDAGGANFDAVCLFTRESMNLCGLPACALVGRSATKFNGLVRSRLRNEINATVLCGDEAEQLKSGTGKKYMFWNADLYKERVQRAFLAEVGAAGGCSLYQGGEDEHTEFAIQFCNERLKGKSRRLDGRDEYFWKTSDPHDYLDTMAMCLAVAGSQGLAPTNIRNLPARRILRTKPRVRIV